MDLAPLGCTDNTCDDHRRCFVDEKFITETVNCNFGLQRARLELALVLALRPAEHGNATGVKGKDSLQTPHSEALA